MSSLKSILGFVLMGLLVVAPGHAQGSEDCPYPLGREIQDLMAMLAAHNEWFKRRGWANPEVPGRANFCNTNLRWPLEGANLARANLEGAGTAVYCQVW